MRVGLFVAVIALAVVRASAFDDLGPAGLVVVSLPKLNAASLHFNHGRHCIN